MILILLNSFFSKFHSQNDLGADFINKKFNMYFKWIPFYSNEIDTKNVVLL